MKSYQRNCERAWKLVKESDGQRGRDGGMKQYIVRIEKAIGSDRLNVVGYWGKDDVYLLNDLQSKHYGSAFNYNHAVVLADQLIDSKRDKGYWISESYIASSELVS